MSAVYAGLLGFLFTINAQAGIYGVDDRYATYEIKEQDILTNAEVSAALVERAKLIPYLLSDGSGYLVKLTGLNLYTGKASQVCSNTKFYDTLALSECSGALIGPSTIISAGHCFRSAYNRNDPAHPLAQWVWVFDYKSQPGTNTIFIPKESVFDIRFSSMADLNGQSDFALFKLDRPSPREPALFSLSKNEITFHEEHYMVGHPSGVPQVVSRNGFRVPVPKELEEPNIIYSNIDAFGGNSGSPVFDARSHEIVGILTRGKNDYDYDQKNKCFFADTCPTTGCPLKKVDGEFIPTAETVFKISDASGLLAKVYEYDFRDEVEYAISNRLNRYLSHVFDYMDNLPYDTYMKSSRGNNILSLLIQSGSMELVQRVLSSKRLLKLAMSAGKDLSYFAFRFLPEPQFLEMIRSFPDGNFIDPNTRQHLIFNAIELRRTLVIEAFLKNGVTSKMGESERLKLKAMLAQKGYSYVI